MKLDNMFMASLVGDIIRVRIVRQSTNSFVEKGSTKREILSRQWNIIFHIEISIDRWNFPYPRENPLKLRTRTMLSRVSVYIFSESRAFNQTSAIDPRIVAFDRIHRRQVCYCLYAFQGMIYLHESVIKFHGSLSTSNCLVDSRWVVKLADFGLHEFKKDAECEPCDVMKKYHGNLSNG